MQHGDKISLTAKDEQFISAQIEAGVYGSASEVVSAALRLLETEQSRRNALAEAIAEGDAAYARSDYTTYTEPGQLAADLKAKLRQRLAAKDQGGL